MVRRSLPPLIGLRAFEAFARAGSMVGAAKALCVTHGAVSRQVRGLEAQLGVRLVEGARHQLRLTEAGATLAAALSSAFDLISAALPGAGGEEEMVLSCPGTFAMKWLIPRLPRFLDAHPGLRVRIVESHAPVDFSTGGLHGAIRIEYPGAADGVRALAFMDHAIGPVVAPALLDAMEGDPQGVFSLPRLTSETFPPAWARWAAKAGVVLPEAPLYREFEHNFYMLEAVVAGLGAAVAPWAFAAGDIERGRLAAPFGFEASDTRFLYLRPRVGDNPAAAAFGDWLRDEARRAPKPPPAKRH